MRDVDAVRLVMDALHDATDKHGPMASPHEGYAVILEELEELWEEIRGDRGRWPKARTEAAQVAAMALRYLIDLAPELG